MYFIMQNSHSLKEAFDSNFVPHSFNLTRSLQRVALNCSLKTVCSSFVINDRCKIVSDFFIKIMFQSLLVSQCKVFFSETVCFNLYYLCFYYYLLARNFLVSCCNCSPNLVGFFANIACCKKKNVISSLGRAQFFPIRTSRLVNNTYLLILRSSLFSFDSRNLKDCPITPA